MEFYFSLRVSYDDFLPYYQGTASKVLVKDSQGRELLINGRYFRPFVNSLGVNGHFKLCLDNQGNFLALEQV
ncbi:DUF2835 domain-containing protein [Shewanella sp. SR44-3]|uniref:DUF2835 domain-containing protein n=1 Tax=unclassified Shewanella TaxID=196818 RepID=UPI0015F9EC04|nr:DUF2835 domain-containing protein [Shewanella sp. SR44-3]MBB1267939.1 DUF2835 domain-containing protein [Shewanella sp. SR44-3]